jgi:glycosyltransferase involved in cell wall biosynthesis
MKKKILIITLSDLRYDARVRRQVEALEDQYSLTLAGFNGTPSGNFNLISLEPTPLTLLRKSIASAFLLARSYTIAHRILHNYLPILKQKTAGQKFDLIIANDVEALPLAFGLDDDAKVLFDAHEYAPRHFEDKRMWRIFFKGFNVWLCKKYIPRTAAMTTVGNKLAQEYKKHFHIDPVVIVNANNYFEAEPSPMQPGQIRLVHVGIANPSRRLELMIELMDLIDDRFTLDLYLLIPGFASAKTKNYIQNLKDRAAHNDRIKIHPPVESKAVVQTMNKYDVGVFLLPPINFNYQNALPNKLFDFIQGRLAIAIGPTPEMAEITRIYKNGVVSKEFTPQSLASELNSLSAEEIFQMKKNSAVAALEFNAENSKAKLLKLINAIVA